MEINVHEAANVWNIEFSHDGMVFSLDFVNKDYEKALNEAQRLNDCFLSLQNKAIMDFVENHIEQSKKIHLVKTCENWVPNKLTNGNTCKNCDGNRFDHDL